MGNEAVNELLVQEENFNQLRESIADYDAFDQIALAQQLQKHELLEFRRIAAHLYRTNKRYTTSITLSKQDGLWQDAMETAALSREKPLAEELSRFFVENIKKDACPKSCFAACLFTCFELIRPDVVLDHVGFGLGYDARAIASGSRAAGVIGGQSTLGHSIASAFAKREAEAEPYLGYAGLGYAGLGYGYAGAYGYGKSAPCVNAANFPVPCRGF